MHAFVGVSKALAIEPFYGSRPSLFLTHTRQHRHNLCRNFTKLQSTNSNKLGPLGK